MKKEGQLDPKVARETLKYLSRFAIESAIGKAGQYLEELDRIGQISDLPTSDKTRLLQQTWDELARELGEQLINGAFSLAKHRLALLKKD